MSLTTINPLWVLSLFCLLVGGVGGYLLHARTHPGAAEPLSPAQTAALVERIYQQTGVDPAKPQAVVVPPSHLAP